MSLIDTNIISEVMKSSPTPKVIDWFNQQDPTTLFISSITIAEVTYGIYALPNGARKNVLENTFNKILEIGFNHRILSFDQAAAFMYGKIMSRRKESGKPMNNADGQIAAIASSHRLSIATRNIKDFADCGIELINPFT